MKMKNVCYIAAALVMVLGLTACGSKAPAASSEPASSQVQVDPETLSPANRFLYEFTQLKAEGTVTGTEAQAEALVTAEWVPFGGAFMAVEPGYLNGFSEDVDGFSEGTVFAPMIGSIPFVGYLFETEDPEALMQQLKDKADLRWNICTQADEMVCENVDGTVFFVMAPAKFEE